MKKCFVFFFMILMMVPLVAEARSTTEFDPLTRTSNSTFRVDVMVRPDPGYTLSTLRWRWTNSSAYSLDPSWYTNSVTVNVTSPGNYSFDQRPPGGGTWYLHVLADSQRSGAFGGSFHRLYSLGGVYIVTMPLPPADPPPAPLIGIYFWEPFTITRVTQYRWDIEREFVEIPGYEEEVNLEVTYEVRKGTVSVPASVYLTE